MHVLLQFRHSAPLEAAAADVTAFAAHAPRVAQALQNVSIDSAFAPVQTPTPISLATGAPTFSLTAPVTFSLEPQQSTYLVRAELPDDHAGQQAAYQAAFANPDVVGVWADPVIETLPVYCGNAAVGTSTDVAALLAVAELHSAGMDGSGVDVAVVDGGIDVAYLRGKGLPAQLSAKRSYTPEGSAEKPGAHKLGHGTMCAFDVGIAAPKARLLDHAVLLTAPAGPTTMSGYLSNAVASYGKLLQLLTSAANPRPLVVSNSWGVFDPAWDFPPGNPGNYTDNPSHPFNVIVASLEHAGADILFAAGNCGRNCPDIRCKFAAQPICGANSHPKVLSIAGIDVKQRRLGYSSQGPGRLSAHKPDVATFSHFTGSGALSAEGEPADVGTSAACPVAAGVIAAVRSKYRPGKVTPEQLRSLVCKTARELGPSGWDADYGWGALDPAALRAALAA